MNKIPHKQIIGINVSRNCPDFSCLSEDRWLRLPNMDRLPANWLQRRQDLPQLCMAVASGPSVVDGAH